MASNDQENEGGGVRISLEEALGHLPEPVGERFAGLFGRHDLEVEIYAPRGEDLQTPHSRDEIYIVARGEGFFVMGSQRQPFRAGDFLFAPAGMAHCFERFTDDLAVWVFFFGPEGG